MSRSILEPPSRRSMPTTTSHLTCWIAVDDQVELASGLFRMRTPAPHLLDAPSQTPPRVHICVPGCFSYLDPSRVHCPYRLQSFLSSRPGVRTRPWRTRDLTTGFMPLYSRREDICRRLCRMIYRLKFILPCSHGPVPSFYAVQAGTSANIYPDGEADSVLLSDRTDAAADIASLFSGIDAHLVRCASTTGCSGTSHSSISVTLYSYLSYIAWALLPGGTQTYPYLVCRAKHRVTCS